MKIVVIAERPEIKDHIRSHFGAQGSEIIQYWNPIKAMDNIDEIEPDLVLFSALDFPRHWKPFLVFLRSSRGRDSTVFVLLKGDNFPFEEASKAHHLGANGIVHEDLENRKELNRLKDLVSRYKDVLESRKEKRHVPDDADRIAFMFAHPDTLRMVTGTVGDISTTGIRFTANVPDYVVDLGPGTSLPACSLRVGDEVISIDCMVVRNERSLHLFFKEMDNANRTLLAAYLDRHGNRALEKAAHTHARA